MPNFHEMTDKQLLKDLYETYSVFHEVLGKMIDDEIDFENPDPEIAKNVPRLAHTIRDLLAVINVIREFLDGNANFGLLIYQSEMYDELTRRWNNILGHRS